MAYSVTVKAGTDLATLPSAPKQVEAGTTSSIVPGMPVLKDGQYVVPVTDGTPVIGTDIVSGVAISTSTETASANGKVNVVLPLPDGMWYANAKTLSTIDTQAEYDALVGTFVVFDVTGGVITIDAATPVVGGGLEIVDNDISVNPGKVAFRFRMSGTELN